MKNDMSKQELYEAVKTLVDLETTAHLHLNQHKLFTLFSIAFQYLLFKSTKNPGAYIIRTQDSALADKLSKRSKDSSTRKFMATLLIPRKFKYGSSTFYLDFFHLGSWNLTNDIPKEKIKAALIVKNPNTKPMDDLIDPSTLKNGVPETGITEADFKTTLLPHDILPEDYYHTSLLSLCPKTITIAFEKEFPNLTPVNFPFIKKEKERTVHGVTLASDLDFDELDPESEI